MSGPTRRAVLEGLAAGLALAACGATDTSEPPPVDEDPPDEPAPIDPPDDLPEATTFPLGVSAGDLATDRAVLWTRHTGDAALALLVWKMDGDTYAEELGPFPAEVADGFAHVAVTGLVAGARYRYAFVEGERVARSAIGRFRAPIADDASEPLTFGAIACTEGSRSFDVLARAAERDDLDAFLFCGDNAYCDGAETLDDYRALYAEHYGRPEHVAIRARTGMYVTWDDHEVKNDWNPETIDEDQLAAAFQAFFEHAPVGDQGERRIWRSSRWGRTVEIFVLDGRSERKPSSILFGEQQYLSPAQMAWLKSGLQASEATFKLIVNSVPITNMPSVWDAYPTDRWEAYRDQRTDILSFIDDQAIEGVLWVSGDFHLAFISQVSTSGPGATQREVLVGPGAQSANLLLETLQPPQFAFATGTNNYTTLKLDPTSRSVTVAYHDATGAVFHQTSFVP